MNIRSNRTETTTPPRRGRFAVVAAALLASVSIGAGAASADGSNAGGACRRVAVGGERHREAATAVAHGIRRPSDRVTPAPKPRPTVIRFDGVAGESTTKDHQGGIELRRAAATSTTAATCDAQGG